MELGTMRAKEKSGSSLLRQSYEGQVATTLHIRSASSLIPKRHAHAALQKIASYFALRASKDKSQS
jgi:hypothetical protein